MVVFLAAVLQVSAMPQLTPTDSVPDLVLIVVVSLALVRGPESAAFAGFAGGLLIDAVTGGRLGFSSLLYVLAAWLVGRIAQGDDDSLMGVVDEPMPARRQWGLCVVAVLGVQLGLVALEGMVGDGLPLGYTFNHIVWPTVLMTAVVALPLLPLLRRLLTPGTRTSAARAATV